MKANELRIGNYVIQDVEFIRGISSMSLHKFNLGLIQLKPIPLTEEFYRKIQNKLFEAGLEYSYSSITNRLFIYIGNRTIICEFIHNIQNLFFALTNKELKII